MNGAQVAEVLVVRAVEERNAEAIPPDDRIGALSAAGAYDESPEWYARRAGWLLEHGLAGYSGVRHLTEALSLRPARVVTLGFVAGALTNYLGTGGEIHVLYNPIAALVLWNLAVAAAAALRWPLARRAGALSRARLPELSEGVPRPTLTAPRPGLLTRWLLHRLWPGLFLRLARGALDSKERARDFSRVARRFWGMWVTRARPALLAQLRRNLHWAALGVVTGAVAGMFVRGLFLEYHMVWRSTFLHDPEVVASLLRVTLGPAALALGEALPSAADVRAMAEPAGVGAARWISLYAVTAALFVGVPRILLALRAGFRLRRIGREVDLDFGEDYFLRIRAEARAVQVDRITEQIESDVRTESLGFAEDLAEFVSRELYDARLAPRVSAWREAGGSLAALEEEFRIECEVFGPQLEAHLPAAQARFEEQLSRAVEGTVGVRAGILADPGGALAEKLGDAPGATAEAVSRSLGHQIADGIGAAVSTATAGVAGAISGGFGKVLGAAIVVKLLGTTGPVGFLIGALGGAVVAVSAWWAGRDRVAARIKQVSVPSWLTRIAMPAGRSQRLISEGRERCASEVRGLVAAELEPLTPQIADQIWTRVKPLLGELQQRRFQEGLPDPAPQT